MVKTLHFEPGKKAELWRVIESGPRGHPMWEKGLSDKSWTPVFVREELKERMVKGLKAGEPPWARSEHLTECRASTRGLASGLQDIDQGQVTDERSFPGGTPWGTVLSRKGHKGLESDW